MENKIETEVTQEIETTVEANEKNSLLVKALKAALLAVFVAVALILLCNKSDKLFDLIGYRSYTVLSGSMEQEFYPGDIVIVKNKNKTNIEVNDIVTYVNNEGVVITHRIVEEVEGGFITKGDNNSIHDTEILTMENILGEVKLQIPKLGFIVNFLSNPVILALEMVLLSLAIFLGYKDK